MSKSKVSERHYYQWARNVLELVRKPLVSSCREEPNAECSASQRSALSALTKGKPSMHALVLLRMLVKACSKRARSDHVINSRGDCLTRCLVQVQLRAFSSASLLCSQRSAGISSHSFPTTVSRRAYCPHDSTRRPLVPWDSLNGFSLLEARSQSVGSRLVMKSASMRVVG